MTFKYLDTLRKTFAGERQPASEKKVCETMSWQAQAQNGDKWRRNHTALCRPLLLKMTHETEAGTSPCVQAEGPRQSSNRDLEKLLHKDSRDKGPGGRVKEMEQSRWGWIGKVGQKLSPRPMPHGQRNIS